MEYGQCTQSRALYTRSNNLVAAARAPLGRRKETLRRLHSALAAAATTVRAPCDCLAVIVRAPRGLLTGALRSPYGILFHDFYDCRADLVTFVNTASAARKALRFVKIPYTNRSRRTVRRQHHM